MNKLIRFDWAIKTVLRKKDNFDILEAFISDLTGTNIKIQEIIESESNQEEATDKFNRVDILVKDENDSRYIIEIQNNEEKDYLKRMLYGTSKSIVENISLGQRYQNVVKVISINIVYFELGKGEESIYHGKTEFSSYYNSLDLNEPRQIMLPSYSMDDDYNPEIIFPEYYIIMPNRFRGEMKHKFDEWLYLLKNSEVSNSSTSEVMDRVGKQLNLLKMDKSERKTYERFIENQVIYDTQIETAEAKGLQQGIQQGELKKALEIATAFLDILDNETIALKTGVSLEEIQKLREKF